MPDEPKIPDLLPWNFAPETVLTPVRILDYQAELIELRSSRRLRAYVKRVDEDEYLNLEFVVEAPVLQYAVRLFYCSHRKDLPYPVTVFSDSHDRDAHNEADFRKIITDVFKSNWVIAVFHSLIARIEEAPSSEGSSSG